MNEKDKHLLEAPVRTLENLLNNHYHLLRSPKEKPSYKRAFFNVSHFLNLNPMNVWISDFKSIQRYVLILKTYIRCNNGVFSIQCA